MILASTLWAGAICKRANPFVPCQNHNFAVEMAFCARPCRHGAKWQLLLTSNPIYTQDLNFNLALIFGGLYWQTKTSMHMLEYKTILWKVAILRNVEVYRREELLIKGSMDCRKERYHRRADNWENMKKLSFMLVNPQSWATKKSMFGVVLALFPLFTVWRTCATCQCQPHTLSYVLWISTTCKLFACPLCKIMFLSPHNWPIRSQSKLSQKAAIMFLPFQSHIFQPRCLGT